MNENINLCEILKDCPKGTKFYSPILGEVTFMGIDWDFNVIKIIDNKKSDWYILHDGHMIISCIKTEEVTFFPSKDQHDWNKFKAPWLKKLIMLFTDPDDVVIDPTAGSCSSVIAAASLNRKAYGFEINKQIYTQGVQNVRHYITTDPFTPSPQLEKRKQYTQGNLF